MDLFRFICRLASFLPASYLRISLGFLFIILKTKDQNVLKKTKTKLNTQTEQLTYFKTNISFIKASVHIADKG